MDRDAEIQVTVVELTQRFPAFPAATIDRLVRRLFAEFDGAPVQHYVPVLVRRAAELALRDVDHLPAGDGETPVRLRQPA